MTTVGKDAILNLLNLLLIQLGASIFNAARSSHKRTINADCNPEESRHALEDVRHACTYRKSFRTDSHVAPTCTTYDWAKSQELDEMFTTSNGGL